MTMILVCLLSFAMPLAAAQDTAGEPSAPSSEARRLLDEAQANEDAGRYGVAFEGYMALYEEMRRNGLPRAPIALWNAGRALRQMPGREADARDTLQRFLDESTGLTDDPQVRDWRSTAVEHIAELDARSADDRPSETEPGPAADDGGGISPIGPVVMGVGGAVLIAGGILGLLALLDGSDLRDQCGGDVCPPSRADEIDDLELRSALADGLLFGGAAIAVTGLVLTFVLDADSETEQPVALRLGAAL
jgi:hypothetical protein